MAFAKDVDQTRTLNPQEVQTLEDTRDKNMRRGEGDLADQRRIYEGETPRS